MARLNAEGQAADSNRRLQVAQEQVAEFAQQREEEAKSLLQQVDVALGGLQSRGDVSAGELLEVRSAHQQTSSSKTAVAHSWRTFYSVVVAKCKSDCRASGNACMTLRWRLLPSLHSRRQMQSAQSDLTARYLLFPPHNLGVHDKSGFHCFSVLFSCQ